MEQILIIEDDIGLNQGLCKALQSENRKVVSCQNLKNAREQLMCGGISLVLLDINLPDGSGLDLLSEIKNTNTQTPVILLTAIDTDMDIVAGLEQGADDYITKPFSLAVLRARVNTQLRKAINKPTPPSYNLGNYTFDFDNMKFTTNGTEVELSKTEQKLLRILVENQGNIISRSTLVDYIWTDGAEYVDENALSVTVKRLRDKLNAYDNIKTIYGLGYRWENSHE
jgi:DNA-binding response OmpR family regulator